MIASATKRRPSSIDALGEGISHMREKLFPFNFLGWVTLGFVSLLESCGSGSSGGVQNPGGTPRAMENPLKMVEVAFGWIAEHMILFVSVLMMLMVVSLVIMWLRSRTIFVYIDDVASGRFDLIRPWNEHGAHADSFFFLSVVVQGASFILMVLVLGFGGFFGLWARANNWAGGAIALVLIPMAFLFALSVLLAAVLSMVLRDFIAPLQITRNVSAREAGSVFLRMLSGSPGILIGYAFLKLVVSMAAGLVIVILSCMTCCIGALPLVNQTLFQPIYFAERAWSLKLLAQMGEDVFSKLDPPQDPGPWPDDAPTGPIDLSAIDFEPRQN